MSTKRAPAGFTIVELVATVCLISAVLAVTLPALSAARQTSRIARCAANQVEIGAGWELYLSEAGAFPCASPQPDWRYAGASFSRLDGRAKLDFSRPLSPFFSELWNAEDRSSVFYSPLDEGITDPDGVLGTGSRTAFRSFGTSYRANTFLVDARSTDLDTVHRGLRVGEITADPDKLVLMGAPVWYETLFPTGRQADWYGRANAGNMLFLDGSVRFVQLEPGRFESDTVTFLPQPGMPAPK